MDSKKEFFKPLFKLILDVRNLFLSRKAKSQADNIEISILIFWSKKSEIGFLVGLKRIFKGFFFQRNYFLDFFILFEQKTSFSNSKPNLIRIIGNS